MRQRQEILRIRTPGRGLHEVTDEVAAVVARSGVTTGLCSLSCLHTSASLLIQENADPSVVADLLGWLSRIAPDGDPRYRHDAEGPDEVRDGVRGQRWGQGQRINDTT
jgi:secondary thiamine-phosphate synthase enzyme